MNSRIPATIVTGFLGSGKTTLIRNLLEGAHGRRIALIVNEFGDVGVDGELLRGCGVAGCAEEDIVELANGCICCTVAEDFLPTMQALLDRPDPPDHIVIETSGLALPQPLVQAFNWPDVATRVTVDGVIAVVDGPAVLAGRFAADPDAVDAQRRADEMLDHDTPLGELFHDQLQAADIIVANKTDLLAGPAERRRLRDFLEREARAGVPVLEAAHGRLPIDVLLGIGAAAEADVEARGHHHHDEADGHHHDHDAFESFVIELPEIANPAAFTARLAEVIRTHDILRTKGFAAVSGRPMRLAIQAAGPRVEHWFERPFRPGEARAGALVVIGRAGMNRAAISQALACAGETAGTTG